MNNTKYLSHTVGRHIVETPFIFHKEDKVDHVLTQIGKKIWAWPESEYIYIVDSQNILIGTVEFKKLKRGSKETSLESIMRTSFPSVAEHTHQENAAKIALRFGIETVPVTDNHGHFLGVVDAGQIFKILHEVHIEKLMRFSGVLDRQELANGYKTNARTAVATRLPSLTIGLLGGILSIGLIESFSRTLEQELILAFFIPIIVYLNDAVGTQVQTIFVRFSALEKVYFAKALIHELKVAIIVGFVLSTLMFLIPFFWYHNLVIAEVIFISIFLGIVSAAVIGVLVPWLLKRFGKDPAIGSGPFTTILQDLLSIAIYFSVARMLL